MPSGSGLISPGQKRLLCVAIVVVIGSFPAALQAQEVQGAIVVARDVPERYAFLPGSGEALTVQTAPFVNIWSGISLGDPIPDAAADAVAAKTTGPDNAMRGVRLESLDIDSASREPGVGNQATSQAGGVGALVAQALDNGMSSLHTGLDQMQSALGQR